MEDIKKLLAKEKSPLRLNRRRIPKGRKTRKFLFFNKTRLSTEGLTNQAIEPLMEDKRMLQMIAARSLGRCCFVSIQTVLTSFFQSFAYTSRKFFAFLVYYKLVIFIMMKRMMTSIVRYENSSFNRKIYF
jgi:hypothetical protein